MLDPAFRTVFCVAVAVNGLNKARRFGENCQRASTVQTEGDVVSGRGDHLVDVLGDSSADHSARLHHEPRMRRRSHNASHIVYDM
jgi:hypothetical protein